MRDRRDCGFGGMQEGLIRGVYELALGGIMPSSSGSSQSYVATVGVAAVAGVAVAAAVGGLIYYSSGGEFPSFSTRRHHSPLTPEAWSSSFDPEEGKLAASDAFITKVRSGGVQPSIRAHVWPFLLGVYELDSNSAERDAVKFTKHEEYAELRAQCVKATENLRKRSDAPGEEEDFQTWQRIIKLDAVRMNAEWIPYAEVQAHVTFEEAARLSKEAGLMDDEHLEPPRRHHAARLVLVLEAYTMYDAETGYCQGMSDLLSPFVALIDEDYEAFWCFVKFMEFARHNFRLDEVGIRRQLDGVSAILRGADPQLFQHLGQLGCEDCTFVYRMVVVLMRRELSFEQTLCLWEVMWADWAAIENKRGESVRRLGPPTRDLLLYTIAAAVRKRRRNILQYSGMDELVRECNGMAGNLDIWELLADARELTRCVQIKTTKSD